jgi:iron complex transport system permease protein
MRLPTLLLLLLPTIILTAGSALLLIPDGSHASVATLIASAIQPFERQLLLELRLPRLLVSFCSGALLASAGSAIQARFQNPLAEPSLVGISGGSALAAALSLQLGLPGFWVSTIAFAGGLLALGLSCLMSQGQQRSERLILAGIAVNALFGSLLTLLISTLPDGSLRTITFWLMGSFATAGWGEAHLFMLATPALAWLLYRQWPLLNALQLGNQGAFHLGFNVKKGGMTIVLLAALASALVVSNCGMLGFIGLMAPHLARQLIGNHAQRLMLIAPLLGGWLTMLADWVAHAALFPAELPVGVITSLAGAPFFLYLLWQSGKRTRNA